ncbi:hypothetical protein pb186bvf_021067 [Paramecium bursaria]
MTLILDNQQQQKYVLCLIITLQNLINYPFNFQGMIGYEKELGGCSNLNSNQQSLLLDESLKPMTETEIN